MKYSLFNWQRFQFDMKQTVHLSADGAVVKVTIAQEMVDYTTHAYNKSSIALVQPTILRANDYTCKAEDI